MGVADLARWAFATGSRAPSSVCVRARCFVGATPAFTVACGPGQAPLWASDSSSERLGSWLLSVKSPGWGNGSLPWDSGRLL